MSHHVVLMIELMLLLLLSEQLCGSLSELWRDAKLCGSHGSGGVGQKIGGRGG